MQLIKKKAYSRLGFMGNPSDGYNGKTISMICRNFFAEVTLYQWDRIEIVPAQQDRSQYSSLSALMGDVNLQGYYGGIRLIKATIKRFAQFCEANRLPLEDKNFSIRYSSNIPRAVGLGGSSAIVVATLRALMEFYHVEIPKEVQPSLALAVEAEELGIPAGLQDRVIQVYEGAIYMDFSKHKFRKSFGYEVASYTPIGTELFSSLYMAYRQESGEPTEVVHNDLRARYEGGDESVHKAMKQFADFASEAHEALKRGDKDQLHTLVDRNFDLRQEICGIAPLQLAMIHCARSVGASAKFAGSGGGIVGFYRGEEMFDELKGKLTQMGCHMVKPLV